MRLRWPCPVPGATPVSEVGDAVVGRGFALLHKVSGGPESVDTAEHLRTLDNPAYSWFGLSSAARVCVDDSVRAVSVAEVVSPDEAMSGPLARDLMVALVRAGVTATCSGADKPRYGHLDVDSNLPDARIALGGPARNAFTKAVLAQADPIYTEELDRQLAETGRARVWVPAATPLAEVWLPGADLRAVRALPVLVIDGSDEKSLGAAIAAVTDDLADAQIVVNQQAPAGMEPFDARTVALLNRGVPSFAVETDGTLHTALMRSCTGWPSGVWIDEPRRTAPDGSNFQLQHWTHVFDYALVSGEGDWRHAQIASSSAQFSHPLLAGRLRTNGRNGWRRWARCCTSIPPTRCTWAPSRRPATRWRAAAPSRSTPAPWPCGWWKRPGPAPASPSAPSWARCARCGSPTCWKRRWKTRDAANGRWTCTATRWPPCGPGSRYPRWTRPLPSWPLRWEAAQPLYARYWLHNRGPAPLGGLPAVAHLHPQSATAEPGDEVVLRLTAASDCTDATLSGAVAVVCPDGWKAVPAELPFTLCAAEHVEADVVLTIPARARPGPYPVRAQLCITDGSDYPAPEAWRQVVEDVCVVQVGARREAELVYLVGRPQRPRRHRPGGGRYRAADRHGG